MDIICEKMAETLDSDPNMIPNQNKGTKTQTIHFISGFSKPVLLKLETEMVIQKRITFEL